MNDPKKNFQTYAEEVTSADFWMTITSKDGYLKIFSNCNPIGISFLLSHATKYLEEIYGDEEDDERLLPPTIQ